jgi:flap endonuclease-1
MGIKNLNKILKKHCTDGIKEINLKSISGSVVAIDTSIYLYKYSYFGEIYSCFARQILSLLKNGLIPIYLFDGKPTEEKKELIKKRKENTKTNFDNIEEYKLQVAKYKEELEKETCDEKVMEIQLNIKELEKKIYSKQKQTIVINGELVNNIKKMFDDLGIYHFQCIGETDIYMKYFFQNNIIDYAITEDVDFLTHGCDKILYNYKYNSDKVKLYDSNIIIKELNLSKDEFIDLCVLLGCDYTISPKNIGPVTAYKLILKHKNLESIIEKTNKKYCYDNFEYEKARNMFKKENIPLDIKKSNFIINKDIENNFNISTGIFNKLIKIKTKDIKIKRKTMSLSHLIKKK